MQTSFHNSCALVRSSKVQLPGLNYKAWFQCVGKVLLKEKQDKALYISYQQPKNEQIRENGVSINHLSF